MPQPSLFRRIVAWYLDLLLISVLVWVVAAPWLETPYLWMVTTAIWLAIEMAISRLQLLSFGYYAMGIVRDEDGQPILDPNYKPLAHWLILLIGVALVYDATRMIGHAFHDYEFYHLLGARIGRSLQLPTMLLLAVAELVCAVGLFRCKTWAPWATLLLGAFVLANDTSSVTLLEEAMQGAMERRSEERGRTLPIEPAALVTIYLAVNFALYAAAVAILVRLRDRFRYSGMF
jgi:hypothetical protein